MIQKFLTGIDAPWFLQCAVSTDNAPFEYWNQYSDLVCFFGDNLYIMQSCMAGDHCRGGDYHCIGSCQLLYAVFSRDAGYSTGYPFHPDCAQCFFGFEVYAADCSFVSFAGNGMQYHVCLVFAAL